MDRCSNFLLLSASHALFSIWTNLKMSKKDPRGTIVEVRRVDLANCALWTSPKFTTSVIYQVHQGFWPDQRSGNPNHPSPHLCYKEPNIPYNFFLFLILLNYLCLKLWTNDNIERRERYSGLEGYQTVVYAVRQSPLHSLQCSRDLQNFKLAYNAIWFYFKLHKTRKVFLK